MSDVSSKDKILIVDDEPSNQLILTEMLEDQFENRVCSTGEEALVAIGEFVPNLVLLDIMMPKIDGYEVCRRIRENALYKTTKIVLVSGKGMIEEKLKGYALGADDYITKPFVSQELLAKAKVFLRLSKFEIEMEKINTILEMKVKEKTRQLYEAEAMLINAAKMAALGEMAGGVAHEINNPLASISLVCEQIYSLLNEDPVKWHDKIAEMLKMALNSIHHIDSIVHGLRTFARDASKDAFDETPLKPIIKSALNLCQAKFKDKNIKVIVDEIDDEMSIYCRPVQITQVLLNLITNAFDAVEGLDEKWIKLQFADKGNGVEILVTDSGKGIPARLRDKVFLPLFTTKEIGKGTGLGLSISKGIVDVHHGTLTLNTKCKNTQFVLFLPKKISAPDGEKHV